MAEATGRAGRAEAANSASRAAAAATEALDAQRQTLLELGEAVRPQSVRIEVRLDLDFEEVKANEPALRALESLARERFAAEAAVPP